MRNIAIILAALLCASCSKPHIHEEFAANQAQLLELQKYNEENKKLSKENADQNRSQDEEILLLKKKIASLEEKLSSKPTVSAEIRGKAFYRLKSGAIAKMAGANVVLIKKDQVPRKATEVMFGATILQNLDKKLGMSQLEEDGDSKMLASISKTLNSIRSEMSAAGRSVVTDSNGEFIFSNPEVGVYYLFAEFNTNQAIGYWCHKIDFQSNSSPLMVELSNANVKQVYESE